MPLWHFIPELMAQPPLEHQIRHASGVLLCRTDPESYVVEQHFKGGPAGPELRPDVRIFELLGYVRTPGARVVLLYSGENLIDLLPVHGGRFVYAPADSSVRVEVPVGLLSLLVDAAGASPSATAAYRFVSTLPFREIVETLRAGLEPLGATATLFEDAGGFGLELRCDGDPLPARFEALLRILPLVQAREVRDAGVRE